MAATKRKTEDRNMLTLILSDRHVEMIEEIMKKTGLTTQVAVVRQAIIESYQKNIQP